MTKTRWCKKCRVDKPIELFRASKLRKDGLSRTCNECRVGFKYPDTGKKLPSRFAVPNHKRFGLTAEKYSELLRQQNGGCAICARKQTHRRLHVDHDHTTGQFRGLICHQCNIALGMIGDNISIALSIANYLAGFKLQSLNGKRKVCQMDFLREII